MHIRGSNGHVNGNGNGGLGGTVKVVAEHASKIARLELELAVLELKRKVVALGVGIALALGAALFGLFMLAFASAAIAAGLATFLPWWAALLATTGILGVLTVALGLLAMGRFARATPPLPEHAIAEAKATARAVSR